MADQNNSHPDSHPNSAASRLAQIVDAFTAAVERGDNPSVDEFVRRYPEDADVLRDVLPALAALASAGRVAETRGDQALGLREELGDYYLESELGRGGMGVVYRARQRSLGRDVALKVLPLASVLDDRQLSRFRNEARAAANLSHPHIVPVYSVGVERGVHYYAMRMIDGCSLADLLEHLRARQTSQPGPSQVVPSQAATGASTGKARRPSTAGVTPCVSDTRPVAELTTIYHTDVARYYRTVARWIQQAALAIDHAHQFGIVHRDIKPANLLLDQQQHLWVTDFGLAQLETDLQLTRTGDVVGTLRYMAPEQARGKTGLADPRSDIYSLGATLYELLTLVPAVSGSDRQEMLDHLFRRDPPPIARRGPQIPSDLQTVVQKAMEKDPAFRYATAGELADDLQRFLEHRPLLAKPPNVIERIQKWVHRHPNQTATSMLVLLVIAMAFGISTFVVGRQQRATTSALEREVAARERATTNLDLARDTIHEVYTQEAETLGHSPLMTRTQREFFQRVVDFYENLPKIETGRPEVRFDAALAYQRLADVQRTLGEHQAAIDAEQQSLQRLERLVAEHPDKVRYHLARVSSLTALGDFRLQDHQYESAKQAYDAAWHELESLPAQRPDANTEQQVILARIRLSRSTARLAWREGNDKRARDRYESLLTDQLVIEAPQVAQLSRLQLLADTALEYATFLESSLESADAEYWYGVALQFADTLRKLAPESPSQLATRARILNDRGLFHQRTGSTDAAARDLNEALEAWDRLGRDYPQRPWFRLELASTTMNVASLLATMGEFDLAQAMLQRSTQGVTALVEEFPGQPIFQERLAAAFQNAAEAARGSSETPRAKQWADRSLQTWQKLADDFPDNPTYRARRAEAYHVQAKLLPPEAAQAVLQLAAFDWQSLVAASPQRPEYLAEYVACRRMLATVAEVRGLDDAAQVQWHAATQLAERLMRDWPHDPASMEELTRSSWRLGEWYWRHEQWQDAANWLEQAVQSERRRRAEFPDHGQPAARPNLTRMLWQLALSVDRGQRSGAKSIDQLYADAAKQAVDDNVVGRVVSLMENDVSLDDLLRFYHEITTEISARIIAEPNQQLLVRQYSLHVDAASRAVKGGRFDEAAKSIQLAMKDAPKAARYQLRATNLLVWMHTMLMPEDLVADFAPCEPLAQALIAHDPTDGSYWNTLATVYYRQQRWREAAHALQQACALRDGGKPLDWLLLARCFQELNQPEDAEAWFAKFESSRTDASEPDPQLDPIVRAYEEAKP